MIKVKPWKAQLEYGARQAALFNGASCNEHGAVVTKEVWYWCHRGGHYFLSEPVTVRPRASQQQCPSSTPMHVSACGRCSSLPCAAGQQHTAPTCSFCHVASAQNMLKHAARRPLCLHPACLPAPPPPGTPGTLPASPHLHTGTTHPLQPNTAHPHPTGRLPSVPAARQQ